MTKATRLFHARTAAHPPAHASSSSSRLASTSHRRRAPYHVTDSSLEGPSTSSATRKSGRARAPRLSLVQRALAEASSSAVSAAQPPVRLHLPSTDHVLTQNIERRRTRRPPPDVAGISRILSRLDLSPDRFAVDHGESNFLSGSGQSERSGSEEPHVSVLLSPLRA